MALNLLENEMKKDYEPTILRPCFSIYLFLEFSMSSLFLSWKDKLLSCGDLPNTAAAVLSVVCILEYIDVLLELAVDFVGEFEDEDDDDEGLDCSGTYETCPSNILVIVWSTLLVLTRNERKAK